MSSNPVLPQKQTEPKFFRLLLSDPEFRFATEKDLEKCLKEIEETDRQMIRGIWWDYEDETTKAPTANAYRCETLGLFDQTSSETGTPLKVEKVTGSWDVFAEQHADSFAFLSHSYVILGGQEVEVALLRTLNPPFPNPGAWAPLTPGADPLVETIKGIAQNSSLATHGWTGQGQAPIGYIMGMALVFARVYCKLKAGNSAAAEQMANPTIGSGDFDALGFYAPAFGAAGDKFDTLRRVFTVLTGLAMPESSGRYWIGLDANAPGNANSEECEAGLFQTSWNLRNAVNATTRPLMIGLFDQYKAQPSIGMLPIFEQGLPPGKTSPSYGSGDGLLFQQLSKNCPAFAAEFTALGLRSRRTHWGTIRDGKVDIQPAKCDAMFKAIQVAVDGFGTQPVFV